MAEAVAEEDLGRKVAMMMVAIVTEMVKMEASLVGEEGEALVGEVAADHGDEEVAGEEEVAAGEEEEAEVVVAEEEAVVAVMGTILT